MRTAKTKASMLSRASSLCTISSIWRQCCMPGEVYQQHSASVQWYYLSTLSLAPSIPTWALLQAPADGMSTATGALCGACVRRSCPGCAGFWWFAWGVLLTEIGVCLCSSFSVTICLPSQMLVISVCSHSLSVFYSWSWSVLPCWCLLKEPLDCFGDQVNARAARHSCVNLSPVATSCIPTPSQCSFLHMNALGALTTQLHIQEAPVCNALAYPLERNIFVLCQKVYLLVFPHGMI